ncbi:unnamed protein product [Prorocentrum cordatum]|uniref:Cilia- and flagella-associated protein 45 n=1 Tax=Prorocentrum cordatum TaxID=2364126 RepID=A0ABN9VJR3_9DINO|nr:unnamed protein product [Polarella glacialis]
MATWTRTRQVVHCVSFARQIQQEKEDEEKQLDAMMEIDRLKALKTYEVREKERMEQQRNGAKVIIEQIKDRQAHRMREEDIRDQERGFVLKQIEALKVEEAEQARQKKIAGEKLLAEVHAVNSAAMKIKEDKMLAERLEEQKIIEYREAKELREREMEAEKAVPLLSREHRNMAGQLWDRYASLGAVSLETSSKNVFLTHGTVANSPDCPFASEASEQTSISVLADDAREVELCPALVVASVERSWPSAAAAGGGSCEGPPLPRERVVAVKPASSSWGQHLAIAAATASERCAPPSAGDPSRRCLAMDATGASFALGSARAHRDVSSSTGSRGRRSHFTDGPPGQHRSWGWASEERHLQRLLQPQEVGRPGLVILLLLWFGVRGFSCESQAAC